MTALRIVASVAALTISSVISGAEATRVEPTLDTPVAQTMTRMRIFSTLLADYQRVAGTYPLADGRLRPLRDALGTALNDAPPYRAVDAWGHPLWYRANGKVHQLISYGADSRNDKDYAGEPLYSSRFQAVVDAREASNDLVLIDGRFVRRPFGRREREFTTIPVQDGWGRPILYTNIAGTFLLASFGENGKPDHTYYPDLVCGLADEGSAPEEGGDVIQACGRFARWPRGTEP